MAGLGVFTWARFFIPFYPRARAPDSPGRFAPFLQLHGCRYTLGILTWLSPRSITQAGAPPCGRRWSPLWVVFSRFVYCFDCPIYWWSPIFMVSHTRFRCYGLCCHLHVVGAVIYGVTYTLTARCFFPLSPGYMAHGFPYCASLVSVLVSCCYSRARLISIGWGQHVFHAFSES